MSNENNSQLYSEINDPPDVVLGFGSSRTDSDGTRNSYLTPVSQVQNQPGNLPKQEPLSLSAQFVQPTVDENEGNRNRDAKDDSRRRNVKCIILLLVALLLEFFIGIGAAIGIGWTIRGDSDDRHSSHSTASEPSSTTSLNVVPTSVKSTASGTTAENLQNPILTIDNITYEIFITSQYLSMMDAETGCQTNSNASLAYFSSEQQLNLFVGESKKRSLPDLLQERLVWEFWISHKTNVVPENSIAYNQLNNSGLHCAILTTWDWDIRQDLYLVTKPCSGPEWRNVICTL